MNCCSNLNYFPIPCSAADDREDAIKNILISKTDYAIRYGKKLSKYLNSVKEDANLSILLSPIKPDGELYSEYNYKCTIKTSKLEDVVFHIAIDL